MTFRELIEAKKTFYAYVEEGSTVHRLSSNFTMKNNHSNTAEAATNLSNYISTKDVKDEQGNTGTSDYFRYMKPRVLDAVKRVKNNAEFAKNLNKVFNTKVFLGSHKVFDALTESKKIQGIKGLLSKYEDFSGSLKVEISAGEDDDLNYMSSIYFEGNTWTLKVFNISNRISQSKAKSIIKKDIENMLSKDYSKYFDEVEEDEWVVDKYSNYIIDIEKAVK